MAATKEENAARVVTPSKVFDGDGTVGVTSGRGGDKSGGGTGTGCGVGGVDRESCRWSENHVGAGGGCGKGDC